MYCDVFDTIPINDLDEEGAWNTTSQILVYDPRIPFEDSLVLDEASHRLVRNLILLAQVERLDGQTTNNTRRTFRDIEHYLAYIAKHHRKNGIAVIREKLLNRGENTFRQLSKDLAAYSTHSAEKLQSYTLAKIALKRHQLMDLENSNAIVCFPKKTDTNMQFALRDFGCPYVFEDGSAIDESDLTFVGTAALEAYATYGKAVQLLLNRATVLLCRGEIPNAIELLLTIRPHVQAAIKTRAELNNHNQLRLIATYGNMTAENKRKGINVWLDIIDTISIRIPLEDFLSAWIVDDECLQKIISKMFYDESFDYNDILTCSGDASQGGFQAFMKMVDDKEHSPAGGQK